jgi:hypothetical protein
MPNRGYHLDPGTHAHVFNVYVLRLSSGYTYDLSLILGDSPKLTSPGRGVSAADRLRTPIAIIRSAS